MAPSNVRFDFPRPAKTGPKRIIYRGIPREGETIRSAMEVKGRPTIDDIDRYFNDGSFKQVFDR